MQELVAWAASAVFEDPDDGLAREPLSRIIPCAMSSVCRSSYKTGIRPEKDRTLTDQDRKFPGPIKTVTAVQSSVHHYFSFPKTDQRPVLAVSTGLSLPSADFDVYSSIIFFWVISNPHAKRKYDNTIETNTSHYTTKPHHNVKLFYNAYHYTNSRQRYPTKGS